MTKDEAAKLHRLIDELLDAGVKIDDTTVEVTGEQQPDRELPKDKRVIRTKSTGDRVYLIDETAKTKAWVTSAEILEKLGFGLADVEEVPDESLVGYAMTASIYKVD